MIEDLFHLRGESLLNGHQLQMLSDHQLQRIKLQNPKRFNSSSSAGVQLIGNQDAGYEGLGSV